MAFRAKWSWSLRRRHWLTLPVGIDGLDYKTLSEFKLKLAEQMYIRAGLLFVQNHQEPAITLLTSLADDNLDARG